MIGSTDNPHSKLGDENSPQGNISTLYQATSKVQHFTFTKETPSFAVSNKPVGKIKKTTALKAYRNP